MRRAPLVFLLVACVAVGSALAFAGISDSRSLAETLGVVPQQVAVSIPPGLQACQVPIDLSASFSGVQIKIGTYERSGPALTVITRRFSDDATLSVGRLAPGYADNSTQTVDVKTVGGGERVSVCVLNRGRHQLALYGGPALAARTSSARLNGKDLGTDISMVFLRRHRVHLLTMLPSIFARAALFRASWVGQWTFWVLAAAFVFLVPLLLALGLRGSER
jgi:hypothetical protein